MAIDEAEPMSSEPTEDTLDDHLRAELTALEQGIERLRHLLQIFGQGHGPLPGRITWHPGEGKHGPYEWIDGNQNLELLARLKGAKGPITFLDDLWYYWLGKQGDRIFRRLR